MASSQRICVLSKLWCRLVIPGAMLKLWAAMQKELQVQGNDFQIYVTDQACTHTWCWGVRMMVQRPMLLELAAFYTDMGVQEGDTVQLYRDIQTNQLVVDIVKRGGAGARAAAAQPTASTTSGGTSTTTTAGGSGNGGSAAALQRAASCASDYAAAAAAALAARRLPGQVWMAHAHKATKQAAAPSEGAAASGPTQHIRRKSPPHSDDDGGDDEDWSPTARGGGRGGRGAGGAPLPVRRKLEAPLPPKAHLWAALASTDSNSDDDSSDVVYTAEQMSRFNALVEAAERMAPEALGGPEEYSM